MPALLALKNLAAQLVFALVSLSRVDEPVGPLVNLRLFVLVLRGLGLSLSRRAASAAPR